jgi:hypothetical protein
MNLIALFISQICSVYMVGVIWIIQLSTYPNFAFLDPSQFQAVHHRHTALMGALVGPVMVIELLVSLWLFSAERNTFTVSNLVIVLILWVLTFTLSVPLHNKLGAGFDLVLIQRLVLTNWPRTIFWTIKAGLNCYGLFKAHLN